MYIAPVFPNDPFFLLAEPDGYSMGPFTERDFQRLADGTLIYADGVTHPVVLQVRGQDGDILHANQGEDGPHQDYRIVLAKDMG